MSAPAPNPRRPAGRRKLLGALRHRNYRLFFSGQIVSTVGTWMQSIAQPWLVLQLTHSGFLVGATLAAQFTPMLVAGPFGGLVADRFPKRRVLACTQALFMVPALALFLLAYTHTTQYWMVLLAAFAFGSINVFDVPARQSFVIEMVGREDLMNAIALNSSAWNGAAVVGPSLAGVLIAVAGVQVCFLVNAISYLAAIGALALMRTAPRLLTEGDRQPLLERIKEGAAYARRDPVVGTMLATVAVFSLFATNRLTLIPLFAEQVLHVGAAGFGFLMAALGLGALGGALSLAFLPGRASGGRQFWVAIGWAVCLFGFGFSRAFWLSAILIFVAGFGQMWFLAMANTRIQMATPDRLRGRVMALYAQALIGVGPLASMQAGALSSLFGAPFTMALGAVLAGSSITAIRLLRPGVFTFESAPGARPADR